MYEALERQHIDSDEALTIQQIELDDDCLEYLLEAMLLQQHLQVELWLSEVELEGELLVELDELEVEQLELTDEVLVTEQLDEDEHKPEEIRDEILELINLMVETEAELIDGEDEVDDGDEIEVYEIEVEMMINELVEEVDM